MCKRDALFSVVFCCCCGLELSSRSSSASAFPVHLELYASCGTAYSLMQMSYSLITHDHNERKVVAGRETRFFFFSCLRVCLWMARYSYCLNRVPNVTTPATSTWCYGPVPRFEGRSQGQPTLLSCDVGLLMASANRSRVESCSGGLELVQCPHYPVEPARVRA